MMSKIVLEQLGRKLKRARASNLGDFTNMLEIQKRHLKTFRKIKKLFYSKTKIPKEGNWKTWTNNDIWLHMVGQVIAVGGSKPAEKFEKDTKLKSKIAYEKLMQIREMEERKKTINQVLRAVGTRFASSKISKCKKTDALVHNFKILTKFKGGPKDLLRRLSDFKGPNAGKRRITYVMKIFSYIKSKGARDYLMELGLVQDAIALDVRIQNIFDKIGIIIPKGFENNPKLYDEIENGILMKICKPLGITGVELDRILYQNYNDIIKMN